MDPVQVEAEMVDRESEDVQLHVHQVVQDMGAVKVGVGGRIDEGVGCQFLLNSTRYVGLLQPDVA